MGSENYTRGMVLIWSEVWFYDFGDKAEARWLADGALARELLWRRILVPVLDDVDCYY